MTAELWGTRTPRRWQVEALPLILDAIRAGDRAVVSAIMGSGKSVLIAKVCASGKGRVVVTVPTVALVDQLAGTIGEQVPECDIGRYYTHAKEADRRVTICCLPSLAQLVAADGFTPPALWIADEAHRTEQERVLGAFSSLAPGAAIGFTATPFLAEEHRELSLWMREIYAYTASMAMRDGVVVPFEVRQWEGQDGVMIDDACADMIRQATAIGPGLVNAKTTDDADMYADRLTRSGIASASVHSKLPRQEIAAVMDQLKAGGLACVVHVNMLTEGVDYPWLRWLCLRRPVQSRVRFCQEVGRVLRASDGKDRAILLDPHDLLGRFSLSYEAILAGMAKEKLEPLEAELREAMEDDRDSPPLIRLARKVKAWRKYLRALHFAALGAGLIEVRVKSTAWRPAPPSDKQLATIKKVVWGLASDGNIPPPHRKLLCEIAKHADQMNKGDASDLQNLLFCLNRPRWNHTPSVWPLLLDACKDGDADA